MTFLAGDIIALVAPNWVVSRFESCTAVFTAQQFKPSQYLRSGFANVVLVSVSTLPSRQDVPPSLRQAQDRLQPSSVKGEETFAYF